MRLLFFVVMILPGCIVIVRHIALILISSLHSKFLACIGVDAGEFDSLCPEDKRVKVACKIAENFYLLAEEGKQLIEQTQALATDDRSKSVLNDLSIIFRQTCYFYETGHKDGSDGIINFDILRIRLIPFRKQISWKHFLKKWTKLCRLIEIEVFLVKYGLV